MLDEAKADVLVGFGGYVSMPAYVAAWRRKTPIVVHEGNAVPGIANKFAARYCTKHVATSFPGTDLPHASYVGLPIRRAMLDAGPGRAAGRGAAVLRPRPRRADAVRDRWFAGRPAAERVLRGCAADLAAAGVQVLHVIGPKNTLDVPDRWSRTRC